jgi:hypothetical protein
MAVLGLTVLASLLAACAGPTVSPSASTPSPGAAATTVGPSASPSGGTASGGPSASPAPSVDAHAVPELEALLPATLGSVVLERVSLTGADFYSTGTPQTRARLDTMLAKLGKTVNDLTVADAGDPTRGAVIEVGAFRVAGADSARLLAEWVASNQATSPGRIQVSVVTVDGRNLTRLVDAGRPVGGTIHAFVKGDVVFLVAADDPALLSAALAYLPTP